MNFKPFTASIPCIPCYCLCVIICTAPLIFGAVHPVVRGIYTALLLVICGGWLFFSSKEEMGDSHPTAGTKIFSSLLWLGIPVLLICFLLLQRLPLPVALVEILSPLRAERMLTVRQLAGVEFQKIPISYNAATGTTQIFFLFGLLLYYAALKKFFLLRTRHLYLVLWCLTGIGVFEALYGLMQFVRPDIGILWLPLTAGRAAHGTIIYKNQYASLLNMIWPLTLAGSILYSMGRTPDRLPRKRRKALQNTIYFTSTTRLQSYLFFLATLLIWLAVFFSLSRGGILTMLFIALFLILFFPFSGRKKAIFFVSFLALLTLYTSLLGVDTLAKRIGTITGSEATRLSVYLYSLPVIREHWLTGIGLGAYALLSPLYLKGFPAHILFDRVHNEYIELFIELGIPMALLFFAWLFAGIVSLGHGIFRSGGRSREELPAVVLAIAALAGILGFLLHGCVDFGWRLPANQIFVVTLFAMAVACIERGRGDISLPAKSATGKRE